MQIDLEVSFSCISLTLEENNGTLEGLVLNVSETLVVSVKKNELKEISPGYCTFDKQPDRDTCTTSTQLVPWQLPD